MRQSLGDIVLVEGNNELNVAMVPSLPQIAYIIGVSAPETIERGERADIALTMWFEDVGGIISYSINARLVSIATPLNSGFSTNWYVSSPVLFPILGEHDRIEFTGSGEYTLAGELKTLQVVPRRDLPTGTYELQVTCTLTEYIFINGQIAIKSRQRLWTEVAATVEIV
ncbi:hypothetical protein ES703_23083 [subsurface metagenome]